VGTSESSRGKLRHKLKVLVPFGDKIKFAYICDKCEAKFTTFVGYKAHMQTIHVY